MSKFHLTPDAKASLFDIALYTQQHWGREQRLRYMKALDKRFHDLSKYPQRGKMRPMLHADMRSFPEGKHVIYYLVQPQQIVIVNILHQSADPERHIELIS